MKNFFVSADVDGRKDILTFGPRSESGEMSLDLQVNDNGVSTRALRIYCRPLKGGGLDVDIYIKDHYDPYPLELHFNKGDNNK
jgi:hypothetical protein